MVEIQNNTNIKIDISTITKISDYLSKKEVELILVHDNEMVEINKTYRDIPKTTDVLSFPIKSLFERDPLGSIVINVDFAKKSAQNLSHTLDQEIAILYIHGLLHLLGYDHENDNGEMKKLEDDIVSKFTLPTTLIQRVLND